MYTLRLQDFRNHSDTELQLSSTPTIIYGANGSGKTNVLEALSLLSTGRSWRKSPRESLIRHGEASAVITLEAEHLPTTTLHLTPTALRLRHHHKPSTLKAHIGRLPSLVFAPEHLHLFDGGKAERQQFFDRYLYQVSPAYRAVLSPLLQAIQQRNSLLKQHSSAAILHPWEEIIARLYPQCVALREAGITTLLPTMQTALAQLHPAPEAITMHLQTAEPSTHSSAAIRGFFTAHRAREYHLKRTLITPTRDDIVFFFRGKPLNDTASRGEKRSILLALLSSMHTHMTLQLGRPPLLLLDDVFSELDDARQASLYHLCGAGATSVLTTTHLSHFSLFPEARSIAIETLVSPTPKNPQHHRGVNPGAATRIRTEDLRVTNPLL